MSGWHVLQRNDNEVDRQGFVLNREFSSNSSSLVFPFG